MYSGKCEVCKKFVEHVHKKTLSLQEKVLVGIVEPPVKVQKKYRRLVKEKIL